MSIRENIRKQRYCESRICSECESCIYDEGYVEDNLNKNNMTENNIPFSYAYCNECPHAIEREVLTTYKTNKYINWFCGKAVAPYSTSVGNATQRNIEMSALETKKVSVPYWCPIKGKCKAVASTETVNKPIEKKPFKDLSYTERREAWERLPTKIKWCDIEINKIYHIPPINGEKRKDILVTSKSDYSISYKNLTLNTSYIETFYPGSLAVKFLIPHKIKEIKVIQK